MIDQQTVQQIKVGGDVASVGTLVATLTNYLPNVAAIVTIVWTVIRIYETETVQKLLERFRKK